MGENRPLKDKIQNFINDIAGLDGVLDCALVSREGHIMGKSFGEAISAPSFAAMNATILASSEAAASIFHLQPPSSILLEMDDGNILVKGAGERTLVTVVINKMADVISVKARLEGITERIGEEL